MVKQIVVDVYLDLASSNGADALLVTFGYPPDEPSEVGDSLGTTFYESLRRRLYQQYISAGTEDYYWIHTLTSSQEEFVLLRSEVHRVLEAEGFVPFAPHPDLHSFFRRESDNCSVSGFRSSGGLGVRLEVSDPIEAAIVAEKILDRLPEYAQMRVPSCPQ